MQLNKLTLDISWNYLSFFILAISGLIINFIIALSFSSEGLGIFNQTYAFFVIFSQFSVFGIHYSVLKLSAEVEEKSQSSSDVLLSGVLSVLLLSILFSSILYSLSGLISQILDSDAMSKTLKIVSPALIFFSLNKVLLSFVNGQERLKLFAIGNILRYIFMLGSLFLLIYLERDVSDIAYIFLIAEVFLSIYCIGITIKSVKFFKFNLIIVKCINHIKFGAKALLSGLSVELNSRADVVILGIFTSDSIVGVYSFFALVAEGLYNIFVVIKNIFNPKITKHVTQKDLKGLKTLIKKIQKIVYPSSFAIASMISIGMYVIISVIPDSNLYYENFVVLIILISSIVLISGIIPFEIILTLAGRPGLQSIQTFITLAFNVILNFILIPYFGAFGAALATASSYIIGAFLLNQFSLRSIGVKIL